MPPKKSQLGKKRKTKFTKKTKTKATAKLSAPVKNAVKKIIRGEIENKYLTLYPASGAPGVIGPGSAWAAAGTAILQLPAVRNSALGVSIIPLLPPCSQGLGENQRIGDKTRPLSLRVDFTVSMFGKNVNANLLHCRLMCLKDKAIKTIPDLIYNAIVPQVGTPLDQQLMDYGNGTNGGYNGVPYDQHWRINTKRYTVLSDLKFELRKGYGQTPQATNQVPYAGSITSMDSAQTKTFSVSLGLPPTLLYTDANAVYPTNFAPFWCFGFCQPDGDGTVSYLDNQVMVNYTTHFTYEDA